MIVNEHEHEILELLWVTIQEEHQEGLPIPEKLPEGAEKLIEMGLVKADANLLELTPTGLQEAARAVRRHRLAERLLADVLVTNEVLIHDQACKMEHALFDGLDDSICTLLGHPRFCPHGRPIPEGDCCKKDRLSVNSIILPLCDLKRDQEGQIAYIHLGDSGHLQKLMAMGVLPGVPIQMVRRFPSIVFKAGNSQFAVDEEIASEVYVRLRR